MNRSLVVASLVSAFATFVALPDAAAQGAGQFGKQGQFAVSGERLFGIVFASETATDEVAGVETKQTTSYTNVNLLMNATGPLTTNYSVPRLAFDYLPIDGLTVGASLGFFTLSGDSEVEVAGMTQSQELGSSNGFLIAPRVGYAYLFTPMIGVWPRAGLTIMGASGESANSLVETSSNRFAVTIEVPLVIAPVPHAGFTLAPTFDIGVAGSDEVTVRDPMSGVQTTTDVDVTGNDFGLQAGLFLYF